MSSSLLGRLVSHFSQPGIVVFDLFAIIALATMACSKVTGERVSAGCEANSKCFCLDKEAVVRHFAKAAPKAGTELQLSAEAAETAVKMALPVPLVATADPLWSSPDDLPLDQCMNGEVLPVLGSL